MIGRSTDAFTDEVVAILDRRVNEHGEEAISSEAELGVLRAVITDLNDWAQRLATEQYRNS